MEKRIEELEAKLTAIDDCLYNVKAIAGIVANLRYHEGYRSGRQEREEENRYSQEADEAEAKLSVYVDEIRKMTI